MREKSYKAGVRSSAIFFLLVAILTTKLRADLVTNLIPSADTALFEEDPGFNIGGYGNWPCGSTAGNDGHPYTWRSLIQFDLSQLPPGAAIQSATLTVQLVRRPNGPGSNFRLFRLLKSWGEGVQSYQTGLPATTGEATWNHRFYPDVAWSAPGGLAGVDYLTNISASIFADDTISYSFPSNPNLVADLQLWTLQATRNFGWIMISDAEGTAATARRFSSREGTTPPLLSIHYMVNEVPATPPLLQVSAGGSELRFSFAAEANRTYALESRTALDNGNWTIVTNLAATPRAAVVNFTNSASSDRAFFRLRTP